MIAPECRPCDLRITISWMVSCKAFHPCARIRRPTPIQIDIGWVALDDLPQAYVNLLDTVVIPPARVTEIDQQIRIRFAPLELTPINEVAAA